MNIFDHSFILSGSRHFLSTCKGKHFSRCYRETNDQTDIYCFCSYWLLPNGEKGKQKHKIILLQIMMNAMKEKMLWGGKSFKFKDSKSLYEELTCK